MTKKLDTFVFKDKFNGTEEEIFEEAQVASMRRAEMMGWAEISTVRTSDPTYKDGEYTCYTFDLMGIDVSSQSEDEEKTRRSKKSGMAARAG
jgi:hypothetical protein